MALTKCRECGGQIATDAQACPHCGAKPPRRTSKLVMLLAAIAIPGVLVSVYKADSTAAQRRQAAEAAEAALTPEQKAARDARVKAESADLAHAQLAAQFAKESAKNPDSVKFDSVFITDQGAACVTYRGTNSYNAIVPAALVITRDRKTVSHGAPSEVAPIWKKHCAGRSGIEHKHFL